jgi:hypothetical protein
LGFFFVPPGPVPPAGLSDTTGVPITLGSPVTGPGANEASCFDAACSMPTGTSRTTTGGALNTLAVTPPSTPTLSEWGMIAFAMLLAWYAALRLRTENV